MFVPGLTTILLKRKNLRGEKYINSIASSATFETVLSSHIESCVTYLT